MDSHGGKTGSAAPQIEPNSKETTPPDGDEVDLWWGSYAGRAMAPSFALCIALTAIIYVCVRLWVPERGWLQLTFTGLASAVWLVQLARWGHRFFTWNYRLTSRFLYVDRGLATIVARRYPLDKLNRLEVRSNGLEKWLGIGNLLLWFDDGQAQPTVLEALVGTKSATETIRQAAKKRGRPID